MPSTAKRQTKSPKASFYPCAICAKLWYKTPSPLLLTLREGDIKILEIRENPPNPRHLRSILNQPFKFS
jgi:hypothetical protein